MAGYVQNMLHWKLQKIFYKELRLWEDLCKNKFNASL